jgi:hypothetical protein
MKKLSLSLVLVLSYALVNAQDQFTNFGNFHVFPGASITFFGKFVNNGTFTDGGLTTTLSGAGIIPIAGSSVTTFYNLVVDNADGVALQQNIIISNSLELTSGAFDLNSGTLTINNPSSSALSRTAGYILSEDSNNSSKLKWNIGNNTDAHVFPFGTAAGAYIPFTLQITGGNIGNVTVSTFSTAADNTPYPTTPVAVTHLNRMGVDNSENVVDRFWQIDKDGVSGTATITFEASPSEVGTLLNLVAQRWNSSTGTWDEPLAGQSSSAYGVTVPGVTQFSPWTLSAGSQVLPIELLSFTATAIENEVELNWKTATEINNDYFTIQRSADGLEFTDIARISAGLNGNIIQKYNHVDTRPLPGKSYYRLKQTDLDGVYKFSDIRKVELGKFQARLTAYPNPVTSGQFSLDFQEALETPTSVIVYDLVGKAIFNDVVNQGIRVYPIVLNNPPAGVYLVKTFNSNSSQQQTIIVK